HFSYWLVSECPTIFRTLRSEFEPIVFNSAQGNYEFPATLEPQRLSDTSSTANESDIPPDSMRVEDLPLVVVAPLAAAFIIAAIGGAYWGTHLRRTSRK
ncbi:MAG: hypothetical protein AAB459_04290, partial [Patescibacteria group bacterium]